MSHSVQILWIARSVLDKICYNTHFLVVYRIEEMHFFKSDLSLCFVSSRFRVVVLEIIIKSLHCVLTSSLLEALYTIIATGYLLRPVTLLPWASPGIISLSRSSCRRAICPKYSPLLVLDRRHTAGRDSLRHAAVHGTRNTHLQLQFQRRLFPPILPFLLSSSQHRTRLHLSCCCDGIIFKHSLHTTHCS